MRRRNIRVGREGGGRRLSGGAVVMRTKRSKQSYGADDVVTRSESRESLHTWMNDVGRCLNLSGDVVVLGMCHGVLVLSGFLTVLE